ncbi:hypothetical protein BZG36_03702 [Bifiguratus adelaidae]|uniref:Uncharacterized protein n=1 Tax=Bifiguratus adelaidae TaxID=1938954 RepID=A0A261XZ38_9FUNG|nr:hypothetical protein BZG36_03702 [Bifiguratus adelaidae]
MAADQRQETLRELCALGNFEGVLQLINAGVDVNAASRMNGWTPLHWAVHRSHERIVAHLLQNGADPSIKTHKGQTALDLAKDDKICNLIAHTVGKELLSSATDAATSSKPEPSLPFVPNYIQNPDLDKVWSLPDAPLPNQLLSSIPSSSSSTSTANHPTTLDNPKINPTPAPSTPSSAKQELLVYQNARTDDDLLGAIYIPTNLPLTDVFARASQELGVSIEGKMYRHNGSVAIPLRDAQYNLPVEQIFAGSADVLLIKDPKP